MLFPAPPEPQCCSLPSRVCRADGQLAEVVADVRRAAALPAAVLEQPGRRLPAQTRESRRERVAGGTGQVPRCCPPLRQPHHQAEVSSGARHRPLFVFLFFEEIFVLILSLS